MNKTQQKQISAFEGELIDLSPYLPPQAIKDAAEFLERQIQRCEDGYFSRSKAAALKRLNSAWCVDNARYSLGNCLAGYLSELIAAAIFHSVLNYKHVRLVPSDREVQYVQKIDMYFTKPEWSRDFSAQIKSRTVYNNEITVYRSDLSGTADRLVFVDRDNKSLVSVDRKDLMLYLGKQFDKGTVAIGAIRKMKGCQVCLKI